MSRKGRKQACPLLPSVALQGNFWQFSPLSLALRCTFSACGPKVKRSQHRDVAGVTGPPDFLASASRCCVWCTCCSQLKQRSAQELRRPHGTERHHLFRKRTQLSVVQLGERRAETALEKSGSTEQDPRRPWGPPVTCSQLVLLGYLGFLELRLNWNHWIGSGRKQTANLRCDSWQEAGRKKCSSWERVAVWCCWCRLEHSRKRLSRVWASSVLEHSDEPGTPNLVQLFELECGIWLSFLLVSASWINLLKSLSLLLLSPRIISAFCYIQT